MTFSFVCILYLLCQTNRVVVASFNQFGIPPETIKDSMQLGMDVPRVYIVPVERFCREQGPSLGVNLAVSSRNRR